MCDPRGEKWSCFIDNSWMVLLAFFPPFRFTSRHFASLPAISLSFDSFDLLGPRPLLWSRLSTHRSYMHSHYLTESYFFYRLHESFCKEKRQCELWREKRCSSTSGWWMDLMTHQVNWSLNNLMLIQYLVWKHLNNTTSVVIVSRWLRQVARNKYCIVIAILFGSIPTYMHSVITCTVHIIWKYCRFVISFPHNTTVIVAIVVFL